MAREAEDRCRQIQRPDVRLRVGVVLMIVLGIGGVAAVVVQNVRLNDSVWDISNFAEASEALLGDVVFLGAALAFLVTLESRIKRQRALARHPRAARPGPHHRHAPAHQGSRDRARPTDRADAGLARPDDDAPSS